MSIFSSKLFTRYTTCGAESGSTQRLKARPVLVIIAVIASDRYLHVAQELLPDDLTLLSSRGRLATTTILTHNLPMRVTSLPEPLRDIQASLTREQHPTRDL